MNIKEYFAPIMVSMLTVAIVGIVLALMNWSSPVLNPILFTFYLTAITYPIFSALKERGMNRGLSLFLLVAGMLLLGLFVALLFLAGARRLSAGLEEYGGLLDGRQAEMDTALESLGLSDTAAAESVDSEQLKSLLASIASMVVSVASDFLFSVVLTAFVLLESRRFIDILRNMTPDHPIAYQMPALMKTAVTYFFIRTRLNFLTGAGFTIVLLLLGVDYAVLWGIMAFFLSYIPYIGLLMAMIPPSLLAWAEYGPFRALLVVLAALVINLTIENVLEPSYTGKKLSLSPAVVFASFFFWAWLLGPMGGILSMPITVMLLLVLGSDEHTQWLARIISRDGTLPQEVEEEAAA